MRKLTRVLTIRVAFASGCLLLGWGFGETYESLLNSPAAEIHQSYSSFVTTELGDISELKAQAQALYSQAVRVETTKGFPAALPLYERVLEFDPSFSTLYLRLAGDAIQQDEPQRALSIVLRGLEFNPQSTPLKALSSWIYSILRQHREAIRVAQNTLQENFEEIFAYRALYESQKALGLEKELDLFLKKTPQIPSTKMKFWLDLAKTYTEVMSRELPLKKQQVQDRISPLYQKALTLDPTNSDIFKQYGDFLLNLGNVSLAIQTYKNGLSFQPDDLDLLLRTGRAEHREGDLKAAYGTFQKIYELRPEYPMLRNLLANLAYAVGDKKKSLEYFEGVFRGDATNEGALRQLIKIYREQKQEARAIAFFESCGLGAVQGSLFFDVLDDLYQGLGKTREAVLFLEKYIQMYPESIRPVLLLVSYYERNEMMDPKIAFFEEMIRKNPRELHFYTVLSSIYQKLNRFSEAGKVYESLLSAGFQTEEIVEQYVLLLFREKQFSHAEKVLQEQKAKFPESISLAVLQAIQYRQTKQYSKALVIFQELEAKYSGSASPRVWGADFYVEKGLTLDLAGKEDLAEQVFQKGLSHYPSDPRLQNGLAYLWAEQSRELEKALVLSQKSLETQPQEGAYLDTLAWIYYKMGRIDEALPLLEQARTLTKEDPEVLFHLAEVYHRLGRIEEATALMKIVLEKEPHFEHAKEKLIALQEELKQLKAHVKSLP